MSTKKGKNTQNIRAQQDRWAVLDRDCKACMLEKDVGSVVSRAEVFLMEFFLIWIAMAVISGLAAQARGRSFLGWFALGFLFSVLAVIAVLVMPRRDQSAASGSPSSATGDAAPRRSQVSSIYRGYQIRLRDGLYHVGHDRFHREVDAKQHIDRMEAREAESSAPATPGQRGARFRVQRSGYFDQPVVGTRNYQDAIANLPQGGKFLVALVCEEGNPHDANAVQVMRDGHLLGYLPRDDAAEWRDVLRAEKMGLPEVEAYAVTVDSPEYDTIGLRLDLGWPPEIIVK